MRIKVALLIAAVAATAMPAAAQGYARNCSDARIDQVCYFIHALAHDIT